MDHLPVVADPLPALDVPFVAMEQIDGGDFLEYPERKGVNKQTLRTNRWTKMDNAASFLQTWLFFGLLRAFLDVEIRKEDFIRVDKAGRQSVTTKTLPQLLEDWYHRCLKLQHDSISAYHKRKVAYLMCAYDHNELFQGADEELSAVSFLVAVLVQTLTDASIILENHPSYGQERLDGKIVWKLRDFRHLEYPILQKRFLDRGWCPNEFARLQAKDLPCTTLYYISNMKRLSGSENHSNCDRNYCLHQIMTEEEYDTRHVIKSCCCHPVEAPMEQVNAIIRKGGIPLVAYSTRCNERTGQLKVTEWRPGINYVAISHVWADGRGNPNRNSLPECQLQGIQQLLQSLTRRENSLPSQSESGLLTATGIPSEDTPFLSPLPISAPAFFWIDTLCIPVHKNDRHLRKQAILRIKDTYANAWSVLALDARLERLQICPSTEECLARIYCSTWMRRCWTLQEQAIAKQCFVKFSDGFFDLTSKSELQLDGSWPTALARTFVYDSTYYYFAKHFQDVTDLTYFMHPHRLDDGKAEQFARAWNCLSFRSTSNEGDRFVILALLLNLDVGAVFNSTTIDSKIRTILTEQAILPLSILTLNVPRQETDGFRWAPAVFGSNAFDLKINEWPGAGKLDSSGWHVTQQGYVLTGPVHYIGMFALVDLESNSCRIVMHIPEEPDAAREALEEKWEESVVCLIFDDGGKTGARLSVVGHLPDGELLVRYDCKIASIECPWPLPEDLHHVDPRKQPGIALTGGPHNVFFVHGERTSVTQKWCIR